MTFTAKEIQVVLAEVAGKYNFKGKGLKAIAAVIADYPAMVEHINWSSYMDMRGEMVSQVALTAQMYRAAHI